MLKVIQYDGNLKEIAKKLNNRKEEISIECFYFCCLSVLLNAFLFCIVCLLASLICFLAGCFLCFLVGWSLFFAFLLFIVYFLSV